MNDFPKKLDQFTIFAAEKVTAVSKELANNNNSFDKSSCKKCELILDRELTNKIAELTRSDDPMLEPSLTLLKQYYLDLFRTRVKT
jgi:hypothetical protein